MTNIHVLIPSYNCTQWIERCLNTVALQEFKPVQVLMIDDASPDPKYPILAESHCEKLGYRYHRNEVNMKCPYNLHLGINMLEPEAEDVIFLLDGDDFLPHKDVFTRYNEIYSNPDTWVTYGNYAPYPYDTGQTLASAYPADVVRDRSFRTAPACFNHPLTFRKFLWDEVTDADMQTKDGRWFTGGYDMVIISPMLEMSAPNHYRFLNETLYMYNAINPMSDSAINVNLIVESREMMHRPKKDVLVR